MTNSTVVTWQIDQCAMTDWSSQLLHFNVDRVKKQCPGCVYVTFKIVHFSPVMNYIICISKWLLFI